MEEKSPQKWTKEEAWDKIIKYCDYQERSPQAVFEKLKKHQIYGAWAQETLTRLEEEGYINVERFATLYARSKNKYQKWGKQKIAMMLQKQMIPKSVIEKALLEIMDETYTDGLNNIVSKYITLKLKKKDALLSKVKQQTVAHFVGKGYSYELVNTAILEFLTNNSP